MPTNNKPIKDYLEAIEKALRAGNATEHTHRPAFKALIEAIGGNQITATNEPKQIACGAPDFIITRGLIPLGYIEAKDVSVDLVKSEKTDQLKRYFDALENLILTDYLSFRWYIGGELKLEAHLPRPSLKDGKIRWNEDAASEVEQLLTQYLAADIPLKSTPKELATRMAGLARLIRDLIAQTFKAEGDAGDLHNQLAGFRAVLIESLSEEQFADMYAQTLCYGLFAARCNATAPGFTRQSAASALPKTNPFLRKLFAQIAGPDLDDRIAWAVDQLATLLARADMSAILSDFGKRTRQEDPVVHFYETFLAAYDPKMREARGVYYTPEPVVGYIVRSVDEILKRDFGMPEGLAHAEKVKLSRPDPSKKKGEIVTEAHRLQILDPATGTGTFLYAVIAKIREHFEGNVGAWPGYVAEHLLPRIYGFELLMAPYAVAHMKLGIELEQSGYDFKSDQRLGVYLTNSLEEANEHVNAPIFTQWLSEESRAAGEVKKNAPVMVVIGNPPYSGHSANTGKWIANLLRGVDTLSGEKTENYFECEGKPLGERNPKWLNDDYVKFIRFAQWRIEQTGHGILAFVTNHGYLDNPTFRGMRESLLNTFDEIYLYDLHGNSKKKEKTPEGGLDQNVFDIQQGVAIGIFVRKVQKEIKIAPQVFKADLCGTRTEKYAVLTESSLRTTTWTEIEPNSPAFYFLTEDAELRYEYERGWKISDVMPVNVLGFQTHRDAFAIDIDKKTLETRVQDMRDPKLSDDFFAGKYSLKSAGGWDIGIARKELRAETHFTRLYAKIAYRPFDFRWGFFSEIAMDRPRKELKENVANRENVCLNVNRSTTATEWRNALISNLPTPAVFVEIKDGSTVFPLWLYPRETKDLLDEAPKEKTANLAPEVIAALTKAVGHTPTPEKTLAYIYAILYAPGYRSRYGEFLKRDFPRIPLTSNRKLFDALVKSGEELIGLHTMETTLSRITKFDVAGSSEVVKVRFAPDAAEGSKTGRVHINDVQFFDNVPTAVWETHIGGYRVAEKWLKDRKGRLLSYDDITHYQSVIAALARTL
jgi:predicted helicase